MARLENLQRRARAYSQSVSGDKVGYRHILLDPAAQTVRFDRPGVEMDPGGIGKGYAVDRMVDVLRETGSGSPWLPVRAAAFMEWARRRTSRKAGR